MTGFGSQKFFGATAKGQNLIMSSNEIGELNSYEGEVI